MQTWNPADFTSFQHQNDKEAHIWISMGCEYSVRGTRLGGDLENLVQAQSYSVLALLLEPQL